MKRREFITLLGSAAVAWPLTAQAQPPPPRSPLVGRLSIGMVQPHLEDAFRQGLNSMGYFEGRNVLFDVRRTTDYSQLPEMAAELVRENVVLIFAPGSAASAIAVKAATATIPIVFACAEDPVRSGLVNNLNRPGGNITGVTFFASPLEQKRVELLNELVPAGRRIALLLNPRFADAEVQVREVKAAAQRFGRQVLVVNADNEGDIAPAFAALTQEHADALLVATDPVLFAHREQIVTMVARHRLPAVYNVRQYAEAGGLLSYGTNVAEMFHQAGVYVGRILAGAKAADLPVQLPTKYELIVNIKTAKALGLEIAPTLLALADEVIE